MCAVETSTWNRGLNDFILSNISIPYNSPSALTNIIVLPPLKVVETESERAKTNKANSK